jgi:hypothetical protein
MQQNMRMASTRERLQQKLAMKKQAAMLSTAFSGTAATPSATASDNPKKKKKKRRRKKGKNKK